jgi:hypothetical protein
VTIAVFVLLCLFFALLAGADLLPAIVERRAGHVVP